MIFPDGKVDSKWAARLLEGIVTRGSMERQGCDGVRLNIFGMERVRHSGSEISASISEFRIVLHILVQSWVHFLPSWSHIGTNWNHSDQLARGAVNASVFRELTWATVW